MSLGFESDREVEDFPDRGDRGGGLTSFPGVANMTRFGNNVFSWILPIFQLL